MTDAGPFMWVCLAFLIGGAVVAAAVVYVIVRGWS